MLSKDICVKNVECTQFACVSIDRVSTETRIMENENGYVKVKTKTGKKSLHFVISHGKSTDFTPAFFRILRNLALVKKICISDYFRKVGKVGKSRNGHLKVMIVVLSLWEPLLECTIEVTGSFYDSVSCCEYGPFPPNINGPIAKCVLPVQ